MLWVSKSKSFHHTVTKKNQNTQGVGLFGTSFYHSDISVNLLLSVAHDIWHIRYIYVLILVFLSTEEECVLLCRCFSLCLLPYCLIHKPFDSNNRSKSDINRIPGPSWISYISDKQVWNTVSPSNKAGV